MVSAIGACFSSALAPFEWFSPTEKIKSLAARYFPPSDDNWVIRLREVAPGPLSTLFALDPKEIQAIERIETLVKEENVVWDEKDQLLVQNLIQKMIESPESLRNLAYRKDNSAYFLLKGALRNWDVEKLRQKIDAMERGGKLPPEYRLDPWDCGVLASSAKWVSTLERLKEKGIAGLDPFLAQWNQTAPLKESPAIQLLSQECRAWLQGDPVHLFLVGRAEWRASKLHSDLSAMDFSDAFRHFFTGDGTHTGFWVDKNEKIFASHNAHGHKIHLSLNFLDGLPSSLGIDFSIDSLINPDIADEERKTLQRYFMESLVEKSMKQRELVHSNFFWYYLSHVIGAQTPFTEKGTFEKNEFCTSYAAKTILEAWGEANQESLRITGHPLKPLFGPHDAISRMTLPQFFHRLKALGVAKLSGDPALEVLNRDRLVSYWNSI